MLVTFSLDADRILFDRVQMQQELASIVERQVDLVSNRASDRSQNWIRRQEILKTAKTIYVKSSRYVSDRLTEVTSVLSQ